MIGGCAVHMEGASERYRTAVVHSCREGCDAGCCRVARVDGQRGPPAAY